MELPRSIYINGGPTSAFFAFGGAFKVEPAAAVEAKGEGLAWAVAVKVPVSFSTTISKRQPTDGEQPGYPAARRTLRHWTLERRSACTSCMAVASLHMVMGPMGDLKYYRD